MSHSRFRAFWAMGCWIYAGASAQAQNGVDVRAADRLRADPSYADVYVNDSLEAADALKKADSLVRRQQWREAAKLLQQTWDKAQRRLVRVAPGSFVSIRKRVHQVMADWPPEVLNAYRGLYEPRVQDALAVLGEGKDLRRWLDLFNRYFFTATAAALADRIGQLAIESGDLGLAEHVYRRVQAHHPDRDSFVRRDRSMLALIAAMRGRPTAPEALDPEIRNTTAKLEEAPETDATLRWMGNQRLVSDVLSEVRDGFSSLHDAASPHEWPIFAGNSERNRRSATNVDAPGLLWGRNPFERTGHERARGAEVSESGTGEIDLPIEDASRRAGAPILHPVVSRQLVFVQRFREIVALNRRTGTVSWRFRADDESAPPNPPDEPISGFDSVTLAQGRLYASLPGDPTPYYGYESLRNPAELICLDARTGKVIWRLDQQAVEEAFAEITFDSSPLVEHGRLFVVGRRRRSFGLEDGYLYRFDAATGTPVFRTHIGSTVTDTFGFRQATQAMVTLHGDTVYVCSNLGTVAAVSAYTGQVEWLRLYERHQSRRSDDGRSTQDRAPWLFNPVLFDAGRLIVLPNDSAGVLVLAADDGTLLDSIPRNRLGGMKRTFGTHAGVLCGVGDEVACYDLAAGRLLWSASRPDGTDLYGRGVWDGDRLLIPTREALLSFRVADGYRLRVPWDADGRGGNLIVLPDQILVAGVNRVTAYVRTKAILTALRKRMAAAPTDPGPALELAEVTLNSGKPLEALAVFDEAVRRATDRSEPPDLALKKSVFADVLRLVDALSARPETAKDQVDKLLRYAEAFPPDASGQVRYRFRFASLFEQLGRFDDAMRLYTQILRDATLRALPFQPAGARSQPAGARASARIAALIARNGRSIYAANEASAQAWLRRGKASGDATILQRIVDTFPNSRAAPSALMAWGDLLAAQGRYEEAARRFERAYHRYPKLVSLGTLMRKIADAYEAAGKAEPAYLWLTKAAREHPNGRIEVDGRPLTFLEYRRRLDHVRPRIEPSQPLVSLPLDHHLEGRFDKTARLLVPRFGYEPGADWSRYFVHTPEGIRAFEASTGRELWRKPAPVHGQPELLYANSQTGVCATRYEIFALDVSTGTRTWSHGQYPKGQDEAEADWEDADALRSHALFRKRLVSASDHGAMTCLAIDTGKLLWSRTHRPAPRGRVRLADRWVAYHVVQDRRPMLCLVRAATGTWFDAIAVEDERAISDLFITLDGQVLVTTSQSILAYNPETRERRWRVPLDGPLRRASVLLEVDALYFSDDGRRIQKISLEDGHRLWTSEPLVPPGDDDLTAASERASLIVGSRSAVSAVDAVTGLTLWRSVTPRRPHFAWRLPTTSYVVAVDVPPGPDERPSVAYFFDHRHGNGMIPPVGGALDLGPLADVRAVMAADSSLLVQAGSTIHLWTTTRQQPSP